MLAWNGFIVPPQHGRSNAGGTDKAGTLRLNRLGIGIPVLYGYRKMR
jgi:hypothetical protein